MGPERPAASKSVGADGDRGREKSATTAASRRPMCGEEVEETAAVLPMSVDLSGEGRSGGSTHRQRRRLRRRTGGEGGGGGCEGSFAFLSLCFPGITNSSIAALNGGLRVRFTVLREAFLQNRHGRVLRPSDRRSTAGIGELFLLFIAL